MDIKIIPNDEIIKNNRPFISFRPSAIDTVLDKVNIILSHNNIPPVIAKINIEMGLAMMKELAKRN